MFLLFFTVSYDASTDNKYAYACVFNFAFNVVCNILLNNKLLCNIYFISPKLGKNIKNHTDIHKMLSINNVVTIKLIIVKI